jgi:hypothetical protein
VPAHKFVVGQKVAFRPEDGQLVNRREVFIVARQLPETGGIMNAVVRPPFLNSRIVKAGCQT